MPKPSGRFKRGENLELKNKTDKEKKSNFGAQLWSRIFR